MEVVTMVMTQITTCKPFEHPLLHWSSVLMHFPLMCNKSLLQWIAKIKVTIDPDSLVPEALLDDHLTVLVLGREPSETSVPTAPMIYLLMWLMTTSDNELLLIRRRQITLKCCDYTEEFYCLHACINFHESERKQVARYFGGLRDVLRDQLTLYSIYKLSQAVNLAYKVEGHRSNKYPQQKLLNIRDEHSSPDVEFVVPDDEDFEVEE
ncbi:hypothetical protein TorRG33x02_036870, partial [Trema orientale]